MILTADPPTLLDGVPALADAIRIAVIFTGFTLGAIMMRVAVGRLRAHDFERGCGMLAFAFCAISPGVTGLFRFGQGVLLWPTITYFVGLTFGVTAALLHFRGRGGTGPRP